MAQIYLLSCPVTLQPKYVGSANDAKKRYKQHLREAENIVEQARVANDLPINFSAMTKKAAWLYFLFLLGQKPVLTILQDCPMHEKYFWEGFWLANYTELYSKLPEMVNGVWPGGTAKR